MPDRLDPIGTVAGAGDRRVKPVDAVMEVRERRTDQARDRNLTAEAVEQPARSQPPSERISPYRVTLVPKTNRLVTEILNTETGEVVQRIPPTYVDPAELAEPEPLQPDPAEAALNRREVPE